MPIRQIWEKKKLVELADVFVPGGMPSYTYQDRKSLGLEEKLQSALFRLKKFVAVAGPTKCGKTVLVRKMVPPETSLWLEGAHLHDVEDFWNAVLAGLAVASPSSHTQSKGLDEATETEANAGFKPAGIGGEIKTKESVKSTAIESRTVALQLSKAQSAVAALLATRRTVVIDDFHYLSPEVQTGLIRGLKQAVFDGLKVVLILIPHRMHQAASAEMDVDGRTQTIEIPDWRGEELFAIAETGVRQLNVRLQATTIETMVQESFQSPHLMQDFCSALCYENGVLRTHSGALKTLIFVKGRDRFFTDHARNISPDTFRALQRGPERTNRLERPMKGGGTCDTYEAVLLAIQRLNVMTPVRWSELRRSLQEILVDEPQQHEVTRVLEKMDEIAKAREGEPVLDYVKAQRELHLVDPFFRYYIKWGNLADRA